MEDKFLERCFELAQYGESLAHPNPIVACVIVHKDRIISEGFHRAYGTAHAELNAINHAESIGANDLFKESSIYVNLEPCAHHGKTPPCADLITKHKFKELIFSSYDPNPEVSGKGIRRIKEAGIKVIEPSELRQSIKDKSDYLNRKFFKWIKTQDPWLSLKIAIDNNGNMISQNGAWITNSESRKDVHRIRSCNDLIISGAESIRLDKSRLNVRYKAEELKLADTKDPDIAVMYRTRELENDHPIFNLSSERKVFQERNLAKIFEQNYKRILIETGPSLSEYFLDLEILDEIIIYQNYDEARDQKWQDKISNLGFKIYKSELIKSNQEKDDIKQIWLR
jgi:diaminohydroxyphosphoribosylaminopyrimidine deaminase / 5-amino-6-(5-phosphoribosylamino)uracil reductase